MLTFVQKASKTTNKTTTASSTSQKSSLGSARVHPTKADYDERDRIQRATIILENYQLLMMYALANDQSIPATRAYFEKVSTGAHPPPIIKNWYKFPP